MKKMIFAVLAFVFAVCAYAGPEINDSNGSTCSFVTDVDNQEKVVETSDVNIQLFKFFNHGREGASGYCQWLVTQPSPAVISRLRAAMDKIGRRGVVEYSGSVFRGDDPCWMIDNAGTEFYATDWTQTMILRKSWPLHKDEILVNLSCRQTQ